MINGIAGFACALSASLGLVRRRAEQRFLQVLDAFGKLWPPFAGEGIACAACGLDALAVACCGLRLTGTPRHEWCSFTFSLQRGPQQLLLLRRERRRDVASSLIVEIGGVLLVDMLLLFRRRIGAGDIELPVLHEIEIAIAAAQLAPSSEFRVALRQRRGS